MKKLKLEIEELVVETFTTDGPPQERGTVEGQQRPTLYVSCNWTACPLDCGTGFETECCNSPAETCDYTCTFSCWDGCTEVPNC